MKKKITAFIAAAVCLIPLTAKGGRQPAWVSNPYAGYDEAKYIAATAGARTTDAADKKAMLSAAANIVQDISAEESVTDSDSTAGANLTSYLSDIRTKSQLKDISGMAIKDRWTAKDKTVYARALLDKTAAARHYSLLLNENSIEIETLIDESQSQKANGKNAASFDACRLLVKAYALAQDNAYYLRLLSVLQPSAHHVLPYGSPAAVEAKLRAALSAITVSVNVTGDTDGRLSAAARSVITGFGIGTASEAGAENAAYTLTVNAAYEDLEKREESDIYFTRSIVNCILTENANGKEILSVSENARQGKLSRKEARQSAVRSAERVIMEEFSQKFGGLFGGRE
ncbi:MAG: hypothetical protein ACTTKL_07260 [Treponema sp.]